MPWGKERRERDDVRQQIPPDRDGVFPSPPSVRSTCESGKVLNLTGLYVRRTELLEDEGVFGPSARFSSFRRRGLWSMCLTSI